jgi:hypothetical protein
LQFLVVGDLLLDGVVSEVDVGELLAASEVEELVKVLDCVALEVEHGQVLEEADVEQLVDVVVREVQLLQVLKRLDTLHLTQLATGQVKHTHELKRRTYVSEALDNRVIHLEVLEAAEYLSDHLQVVAGGVDPELNLHELAQLLRVHVEMLRQELLIELHRVLHLLVLYDFLELLLEVGQHPAHTLLLIHILHIILMHPLLTV